MHTWRFGKAALGLGSCLRAAASDHHDRLRISAEARDEVIWETFGLQNMSDPLPIAEVTTLCEVICALAHLKETFRRLDTFHALCFRLRRHDNTGEPARRFEAAHGRGHARQRVLL